MILGMCAGVLQTCLWWFLQDGNVKTEDNINESSARPHAIKKMVLRWKRMIQEIKIGGMYTGLSPWRSNKTRLDLLRSLCTSVWPLLPVLTVTMFRLVQLSLWAADGTCFMYNDHRGSHLNKCWIVCVCVCPSTDPQECCPPGLPETQHSLAGLPPCCRQAWIRRWWLDTIAPPSGCRRSPTSSWLVSSNPCICRHTTARWP